MPPDTNPGAGAALRPLIRSIRRNRGSAPGAGDAARVHRHPLGLFYSLFTGAFSLGFKTAWPFVSFWILTANRMLGVLVSPVNDLRESNVVMGGWALNVVAYLGCCFLTVLVPMPRFGITAAVVGRQDLGDGGLWQNSPHTAIAFGFFYFMVVGVGEILLVGKLSPSKQPSEQP